MAEMKATLSEAIRIGQFLRHKINEFGEPHGDRTHWTGAVQKSFAAYLVQENFTNGSEVLPPVDLEKTASRKDEFLVDFVLWRRDLGDGTKSGAWIACESEWDRDVKGVLKDFDKLISFRSPYKVMIYEANKNPTFGESCRLGFQEYLSGFHWNTDGEAYIFLEFVDDTRIGDIYTCLPSTNCNLELR